MSSIDYFDLFIRWHHMWLQTIYQLQNYSLRYLAENKALIALVWAQHQDISMLFFISPGVAGKADTSSCFQLVGSANHQPVIWCSVTPTAYCVGDVKLHKASGSEGEDSDCLWLSFCLSVVVIQSKVLCAPRMTVVSPAAGGLSFIPRFLHQVNLKKGAKNFSLNKSYYPMVNNFRLCK